MILTPTYHILDMFKVHQNSDLLPLMVDCGEYHLNGQAIPQISASASVNEEGKVHISVCNLHPKESADITCLIRDGNYTKVSGIILTASEMNGHNTFDNPDTIKTELYNQAVLENGKLRALLLSKSVVVLSLE